MENKSPKIIHPFGDDNFVIINEYMSRTFDIHHQNSLGVKCILCFSEL